VCVGWPGSSRPLFFLYARGAERHGVGRGTPSLHRAPFPLEARVSPAAGLFKSTLVLNDLALLMLYNDRHREAELLVRRALADFEKNDGLDRPRVKRVSANLQRPRDKPATAEPAAAP
jgi:hypothetical protein